MDAGASAGVVGEVSSLRFRMRCSYGGGGEEMQRWPRWLIVTRDFLWLIFLLTALIALWVDSIRHFMK